MSQRDPKADCHCEVRSDGEAKVSKLEASNQLVVSWASGSTKTSTSMDLPALRHSGSTMTGERGRSQQSLTDGINSLCLHIDINFIFASSTGYSCSWWHAGYPTRQLKQCQVQHFTKVTSMHKRWVMCRYKFLKPNYCTTYLV